MDVLCEKYAEVKRGACLRKSATSSAGPAARFQKCYGQQGIHPKKTSTQIPPTCLVGSPNLLGWLNLAVT